MQKFKEVVEEYLLETTNRRNAGEEQQGQPEKRTKNEQEERGTQRITDEW